MAHLSRRPPHRRTTRRNTCLVGAAAVLVLAALTCVVSCTKPDLSPLSASMVPRSGHPPYEAVVNIGEAGPGLYTLTTPTETLASREPSFTVIVDRLDWSASVAWDADSGSRRVGDVLAETVNRPPTIGPPRLAPYNEWRLRPRERTLIDFSAQEGFMGQGSTGIRDPDGDPWRIENITVQCALKDHPDSIFRPPLEEGVFHALWRGQLIEDAIVLYPCYTSEAGPEGLPYPPQGMTEEGYPHDPYHDRNLYRGVSFVDQTATVTVVAIDALGGRSSKTFTIPVGALQFTD